MQIADHVALILYFVVSVLTGVILHSSLACDIVLVD